MIIYWILFLIPALGLISPMHKNLLSNRVVWAGILLFYSSIIGFRREVGGDWWNYLMKYEWGQITQTAFIANIKHTSIGYEFVNYFASYFKLSIFSINLLCGLIFMYAILNLAKRQPSPFLGLLIAVPFLIIVVSMGYVKQAFGLSFTILAIIALSDKKYFYFSINMLLAFLFHKPAIIILPVILFLGNKKIYYLAAVFTLLLIISLIFPYFREIFGGVFRAFLVLIDQYIINKEYKLHSTGAFLRISMTFIAAIAFLIFRKNLSTNDYETKIFLFYSLSVIAIYPFLIFKNTWTVLDRIHIYLVPLQIFVFSRIPFIPMFSKIKNNLILSTVAFYALALFVWLNFGKWSSSWVPYKFFLI